jgi:hypothetical protein
MACVYMLISPILTPKGFPMKKIFSLELWFYLFALANLFCALSPSTWTYASYVPYVFLGLYGFCLLRNRNSAYGQVSENRNTRFRIGVLIATCLLWLATGTVGLAIIGVLLLIATAIMLLISKPPYPVG